MMVGVKAQRTKAQLFLTGTHKAFVGRIADDVLPHLDKYRKQTAADCRGGFVLIQPDADHVTHGDNVLLGKITGIKQRDVAVPGQSK